MLQKLTRVKTGLQGKLHSAVCIKWKFQRITTAQPGCRAADLFQCFHFLFQNLLLYRGGEYPANRAALTEQLTGEDRDIWDMLIRCRENGTGTMEDLAVLLAWCEKTLHTL